MKEQKIFLRAAEIKDANSMAELACQLGYPSTREEMEKRLREVLVKEDHCVLVVLVGEVVFGWIHGFYSPRIESHAFIEIGGMVVDEKARSRGLGKLLLQQVDAWSRNKNCLNLRVRSNVVRKETHHFYQRMGFSVIKDQKVFGKTLSRLP